MYYLTAKDISEMLQLTRSFLARKKAEYAAFESAIADLRKEARALEK